MPHDLNNKLVSVGDLVYIPCRVKSITMDEQYCNLTVETIYFMPPYDGPQQVTLNTKQVILQEKK